MQLVGDNVIRLIDGTMEGEKLKDSQPVAFFLFSYLFFFFSGRNTSCISRHSWLILCNHVERCEHFRWHFSPLCSWWHFGCFWTHFETHQPT
jgi:hypothetical protein